MQGLRGRGAGRGGGRGAPPGRGRGGGREAANGGCLYSTGGASSAGRGGGGRGPLTREEKKEGRRQKQANAIAAREAAEDQYFKQCQREAHKSGEAQRAKEGLAGRDADAREKALFATQGTQGIQFDKYANIKVECRGPGSDAAPPLDDFGALTSLPPFLARNIGLMNYVKPTPIQRHAVPLALAGVDLMCCAQTGSGKTAAFLVPVCTALANTAASGASTVGVEGSAKPRAVVMAPTRELASQIELEAQKLTNRSPLRPVAVYGGADQRAQARALAVGVDIVVATPGRLNDFVERGLVELGRTVSLVLDEADRMLDMGFEPQIRRIVQQEGMPASGAVADGGGGRQTLMFSATFPKEIQKLASEFMTRCATGRVSDQALHTPTHSPTPLTPHATLPPQVHLRRRRPRRLDHGPDHPKRDLGRRPAEAHGARRADHQHAGAHDRLRRDQARRRAARGLPVPLVDPRHLDPRGPHAA